jgi:type IV secretory pathway protease TraF
MRLRRVLIMLFCVAAIGFPAAVNAIGGPIIVYNPSDSVPSGFYVRAALAPRAGDLVTVAASDVAPTYAALRGFDDPTDRFLKRVAATAGQRVCAEGVTIVIDDVAVAVRAERDRQGRALPSWEGCRTLDDGEVFLLGDTEDSFDGRYWGPTPIDLVQAVWRPAQTPYS